MNTKEKYTMLRRIKNGTEFSLVSLNGAIAGACPKGQENVFVDWQKFLQRNISLSYEEAEGYEPNKGSLGFDFKFIQKQKEYGTNGTFKLSSDGVNFINMEEDFYVFGHGSTISSSLDFDQPVRMIFEGVNDSITYNGREFKFYNSNGRLGVEEIKKGDK